MKNIITILLIVVSSTGFTQNKYKKADRFFDNMLYKQAAVEYEKAIDKGDRSMEILQKAGDAYYFNTNIEGAHKWYDILISEYLDQVDPEYIFRFSHILEGRGEHILAKKWMKEFSNRSQQKDARIDEYSQTSITIEDVLSIESQFTLKNLSINTKNSEFGPMYYGERLIYSSAVDTSYYNTRTYNWNEQPFLNFQLGRISATDQDVEHLRSFSSEINTKYHEATLAFSPDKKKIYFTRNNFIDKLKRGKEDINYLKLFTADLQVNHEKTIEFRNIRELPFNSPDYSVGHPTVSKDGKQLFFVSDMPGSIGATDIYVVDILGDNNYSKPRNLGPRINTSGREMFPYITDSKLYFASDGHLGLGGLDVFEVENDATYENPINLGSPLNSELDDFAFIVDEATNLGFVCSNRKGGKGDDDIYSFTRELSEDQKFTRDNANINGCYPRVKGYVSNVVTGERIAKAKVKLFNDKGEVIDETHSNLNGYFTFRKGLDCNSRYDIKVTKLGYDSNEKPFLIFGGKDATIMPVGLQQNVKQQVAIVTNPIQPYPTQPYPVQTYPVQPYPVQTYPSLTKVKIAVIYHDLNESLIENMASFKLNKVVTLMNQHPEIVIAIESHTDSRSADSFNLDLSDRRAKDSRAYLIRQGVHPSRILSAIGFGETQPVNRCVNNVSCTEEQHHSNRRSEFIIVKM